MSFFPQYKQGKVGPDGKDLLPHESPKVNGFGYVGTPSPMPGEYDGLWDPDIQSRLPQRLNTAVEIWLCQH